MHYRYAEPATRKQNAIKYPLEEKIYLLYKRDRCPYNIIRPWNGPMNESERTIDSK